jgi:hypothetical protein
MAAESIPAKFASVTDDGVTGMGHDGPVNLKNPTCGCKGNIVHQRIPCHGNPLRPGSHGSRAVLCLLALISANMFHIVQAIDTRRSLAGPDCDLEFWRQTKAACNTFCTRIVSKRCCILGNSLDFIQELIENAWQLGSTSNDPDVLQRNVKSRLWLCQPAILSSMWVVVASRFV